MTTKGKTGWFQGRIPPPPPGFNLTFAINVKLLKLFAIFFKKFPENPVGKQVEHDFLVVPVKNFRNGKFSGAKEFLPSASECCIPVSGFRGRFSVN